MKLTKYKISILALALILIMAIGAVFGINSLSADAAGTVTVSSSSVFTAASSNMISAGTMSEGDNAEFYTSFTFDDEEEGVSYRRNLAYHWYEQRKTESDEGKEKDEDNKTSEIPAGDPGYFNMKIGFKEVNFKRFIITFESQNYNKNKDNKAVNYIILFPAEQSGSVYALITDDREGTVEDIPAESKHAIPAGEITIRFLSYYTGEYKDIHGVTDSYTAGYNVEIGADNTFVSGKFHNVKGNFAKSSTSTSSPLYPLIFNAELKEKNENESNEVKMFMLSLNGQSFKMSSSTSTTVTDGQPPVLCLNSDARYLTQGGSIKFDYTVIDVLRSSPPTPKVYYYTLTGTQYKSKDNFYDSDRFEEVKNDLLLESDVDKYLPSAEDLDGTVYNSRESKGELTADMLVKVYVSLSDLSTTNSNREEAVVYLDWYINDLYKVSLKDKDDNLCDFIVVAKDTLGATYNYDGAEVNGVFKKWGDTKTPGTILGDYQAEVDRLAKNLSAGNTSYIYLPSAESLFNENVTSYENMRFSIYYYSSSKSSNTSLLSNNLSINVTNQGNYTFTIYATDGASNNMYYLEETDEEGDVVIEGKNYNYVIFEAGQIWDMYDDYGEDGLYKKLPWFTFEVGYQGVKFAETPGLQSTAYVGTTYTSASFKLDGISGSYETTYRLFIFDRQGYFEDTNKSLSYKQFIEEMDAMFDNADLRKYFKEIPEVKESDEDYELYKDYGWSNSNTTFTPQDANAYYYMRAELKDTQYVVEPMVCGLAIVSSAEAKELKGEDDWFENNIASIVLLTVAGLALIGIILLLVIKPKNEEDIDVEYETIRSKKNSKK